MALLKKPIFGEETSAVKGELVDTDVPEDVDVPEESPPSPEWPKTFVIYDDGRGTRYLDVPYLEFRQSYLAAIGSYGHEIRLEHPDGRPYVIISDHIVTYGGWR